MSKSPSMLACGHLQADTAWVLPTFLVLSLREEASKNSDEQLNLIYICTIHYHLWGIFTPVVFGFTDLVTTKDIPVI